jgi:hypothetical protein
MSTSFKSTKNIFEKEYDKMNTKNNIIHRPGCRDIWNAFMCEGIKFGAYDIPYCPTTAENIPNAIITWDEAKSIYKRKLASKNENFIEDAFVCWYIDDYKFDGTRGIWHDCYQTLKILRHFAGAITPDFSTYQDFPEPLKLYNTYRMRVFGYWLGKKGIPIINNVRWGTHETYQYCFEGIPRNSIVAIGTCGGSPRKHQDRERFEKGLAILIEKLNPHTIIIYGSANYPCFDNLIAKGINIISFPGRTAQAFKRGKSHE